MYKYHGLSHLHEEDAEHIHCTHVAISSYAVPAASHRFLLLIGEMKKNGRSLGNYMS